MSFGTLDTSHMVLSPAFHVPQKQVLDVLASPQPPQSMISGELREAIVHSVLHSKSPHAVSPEEVRAVSHYRKLKQLNAIPIPPNILEVLRECESLETTLCSYFQNVAVTDIRRNIQFSEEKAPQQSPIVPPFSVAGRHTPSSLPPSRGTSRDATSETTTPQEMANGDNLPDDRHLHLAHIQTLQRRIQNLEDLLEMHKERDTENRKTRGLLESKIMEVTSQLDEAVNALMEVNFEADKELVQKVQELEEELEETRSALVAVHVLNWCAEYDQGFRRSVELNTKTVSESSEDITADTDSIQHTGNSVSTSGAGSGQEDPVSGCRSPEGDGVNVSSSNQARATRKRVRDEDCCPGDSPTIQQPSTAGAKSIDGHEQSRVIHLPPRDDSNEHCSGYDCPVRLGDSELPVPSTASSTPISATSGTTAGATTSSSPIPAETFGPHQIHPCTFVLTQEIARLETQLSTERLVASLAIQELAEARRSHHQAQLQIEREHIRRMRAMEDMYEAKLANLHGQLSSQPGLRSPRSKEERKSEKMVVETDEEAEKNGAVGMELSKEPAKGEDEVLELMDSPEFDEREPCSDPHKDTMEKHQDPVPIALDE